MREKLHPEIVRIFEEEILAPVGAAEAGGPNCLTGFLPMRGDLYKPGGLMVVGRATNDWRTHISWNCLGSDKSRKEYTQEVVRENSDCEGKCPMVWVKELWGNTKCSKKYYGSKYNTKRSAFWRVIRKVISEYIPITEDESNFSSWLVWSNLYKLSPTSDNPGRKLQLLQREGCKSSFKREIDVFRPGRLLLLTGLEWAEPFLEELCIDSKDDDDLEHVELKGRLHYSEENSASLVVAKHPRGKKEDIWIDQVMKAFSMTGAPTR